MLVRAVLFFWRYYGGIFVLLMWWCVLDYYCTGKGEQECVILREGELHLGALRCGGLDLIKEWKMRSVTYLYIMPSATRRKMNETNYTIHLGTKSCKQKIKCNRDLTFFHVIDQRTRFYVHEWGSLHFSFKNRISQAIIFLSSFPLTWCKKNMWLGKLRLA